MTSPPLRGHNLDLSPLDVVFGEELGEAVVQRQKKKSENVDVLEMNSVIRVPG